MARKIVWFKESLNDRKQILRYWTIRNQSNVYSAQLRLKIKNELNLVAINPNIGQAYSIKNVRYIVFRDYKIFYSYTKDTITVLRIWDTRRNPEELRVK